MFQVGDHIEVDRGLGRVNRCVILEVDFRNNTYIAKVRQDADNQINVLAWNIYQDGISVKQIGVVWTREQQVAALKVEWDQGFAAGYKARRDEEN